MQDDREFEDRWVEDHRQQIRYAVAKMAPSFPFESPEDLEQEAAIRVLIAGRKFHRDRIHDHPFVATKLRWWLADVAREARKDPLGFRRSNEPVEPTSGPKPKTYHVAIPNVERRIALQELHDALPPLEAEVLRLRMQGMFVTRIAEALNITRYMADAALRNIVARARQMGLQE